MATTHSVDDVIAALPPTSELLVLVDFDGTLSEIVPVPDDAAPVDGAEDALERLADHCPVAIVSGRHVADLHRRLRPGLPVTYAGGHGTEVEHPDGSRDTLVDPDVVGPSLDVVQHDLEALLDTGAGWEVERKPASIAVHHRRVDDPTATLDRVRALLDQHSDAPPGFVVSDGKAVTELRPAGVTKGTIVDRLADADPGRHLLVLGDDVTDEDAFRAARARGGTTVVVADDDQESVAAFRLATPHDVVNLLVGVADRTS